MEFARQVDTLVTAGYPALAGVAEDEFVRGVAPLEELVPDRPFVIVVAGPPPDQVLARVDGFTTMEPEDLARFAPLDELRLPAGPAYLLDDPDTGSATLDVTPDDAFGAIVAEGRSPLTLDEGLAVLVQNPRILRERNCFSMLGSRCGDRRVTALWVSRRRPRLGWCWAGNPHSWLGSASCAGRIPAG